MTGMRTAWSFFTQHTARHALAMYAAESFSIWTVPVAQPSDFLVKEVFNGLPPDVYR
jgi:hypothetical protein